MTIKYFEDFHVGPLVTGSMRAVTHESVNEFAESFDRLPLHLDATYASQSMYGGIIASGLQTLCLAASIVVDDVLIKSSMTGGLGMTNVKWLKPVRPGDTLRVNAAVVELADFSRAPPNWPYASVFRRC
jgi:acyl dehydratase